MLFSAFVILVGISFSLLSIGAIHGVRNSPTWKPTLKEPFTVKDLVPWAFNKVGFDVFADFSEKTVSEKPANYGIIAKEERLEFVKGANLKRRSLTYASLFRSFLVKADLRFATLNHAYLIGTNLQQAAVVETNLKHATLKKANLHRAMYSEVLLEGADLSESNLTKAFGLDVEQLCQAKTLYKAVLDPGLLEQVELYCPHLLKEPEEKKE